MAINIEGRRINAPALEKVIRELEIKEKTKPRKVYTIKEIQSLLDIIDDNKIDVEDYKYFKQITFNGKPRFTEQEFLNAGQRFEKLKKLRNQNILRKAKDPISAVRKCLRKAQYTFIGDSHFVNDEAYFIKHMELFKNEGVRYLAVEIGSDEKAGLQHFLKTGSMKKLNPLTQTILRNENGLVSLMRQAQKHGIKVIPVDRPLSKLRGFVMGISIREMHIAAQLQKLKQGKTIVWIGSPHAALNTKPFESARAALHLRARFSTAGIRLESKASIRALEKIGIPQPGYCMNAYDQLHTEVHTNEVIAIPSSELGEMRYKDPTPEKKGQKMLRYKEAYDYVFLLPPQFSNYLGPK